MHGAVGNLQILADGVKTDIPKGEKLPDGVWVWLKEHGHPPLRRVRTPVLAPLWSHDATVLAEFDREYSTTARDGTDPRHVRPVEPTPDDVHVLYLITPGQSPFHSLDELPQLTHLELVQVPKRVRRRRRS